ncbi:MAG: sigma-70 family RNA polymerase sigma factor [Lachnospiraceae bacterium]|nr:sigma-70 family RNA polymerase sigma factor [Lachnospiraceae bacterium]
MNDSDIIQLYWDRDQRALAATDRKYGRYCASIARNILKNPEDVEECVNDTYWKTWNAIPPNRPQILSAFLGKITRNLAFNKYKHNHAKKRGEGEATLVLEELAECVSGFDNVEQEIDRRELLEAIQTFLDTLSPEKRNLFICRYWYCDSISSIANRYQMAESNVATILSRLRLKLRVYLTERGFEL